LHYILPLASGGLFTTTRDGLAYDAKGDRHRKLHGPYFFPYSFIPELPPQVGGGIPSPLIARTQWYAAYG
jgi:hypothetical protein